jgi:formyltetrahydrofolate deformylase
MSERHEPAASPAGSPAGSGRRVLLVACTDRPGLVATVAGTLFAGGATIIEADQYTDHVDGVFFQRVEFSGGPTDIDVQLRAALAELGAQVRSFVVHRIDVVPRVAVLVSKEAHCLHDLLSRWEMGELRCDVVMVAGNHPDHAPLAKHFGVPFHHVPVEGSGAMAAEAQARAMHDLVERNDIDLVVLARYMRILPAWLCEAWAGRVINIHHSFLPAFVGARPYHQAHARGVKLIGATAHYATADLDQGPIIEQDVARVSHRDAVDDLRRTGRDLERVVLARAVRAHLDHRVLVHANRTVVF